MKKKPIIALFVALAFLLLAVSFPLQVLWAYGQQLSELPQSFAKISLVNYFVIVLSLINAALAFEMSPKLKFFVPLQIAMVAWNNLIVGMVGLNSSLLTTHASTLLFVSACSVFLFDPFLSILKNPTRRWWRSATRVRTSLPVTLHSPLGLCIRADCYDLSEKGLFVELLPDLAGNPADGALLPGKVLNLRLQVSHLQILNLRVKIIRNIKASASGQPGGLGLELILPSTYQKKIISDVINRRISHIHTAA